ncbi:tRNA splicing endonuclease subunit SEN34 [Lachancea thermotolerans CBS 6340]|uniref:tRNA-splicing endonuclease subunit Sen34 n=1 Tax=Lachancea thermotolerans (strain ATCC 56472 / CBS 6340 / NRRL Y-8284) TaxID=559295 RepID=C5DHX9_LACTC|nr:KLTH0E08030p [Lachancea thermotolerans CBS 6340]CAR23390.1 KLTH0E08030p [Lachancea thermotolerans CBS 6340]
MVGSKVAIVLLQRDGEAGTPLVFDIASIEKLRSIGVAGILTGTLPSATQQNAFLSVPLRLMAEEALWLVEKQLGYLVHGGGVVHTAAEAVKAEDMKEARNELERSFEAQREFKRQQHLEKLRRLGVKAENSSGTETDYSRLLESSLFIETCDSSALISQRQREFDKPEIQARLAQQLRTGCKCKGDFHVYKALREQGYFLSPGSRFGGRFIAYPGDPLRYHSHMTVQPAMDYRRDPLDLLQVVSGGRLGTGVKKLWVVGGVKDDYDSTDAESGRVSFFSVEWAGFG